MGVIIIKEMFFGLLWLEEYLNMVMLNSGKKGIRDSGCAFVFLC